MHVRISYGTAQLKFHTCVCSNTHVRLYILSVPVGVTYTQLTYSLHAHMSIIMSIIHTLDECL